jgi:hypothetical protein
MINTDVRDLIQRLYQTAREAHPESQEVFKHICWEAADLIDSFDQRVADLENEVGDQESKYFTLNQLYGEQAKRIAELEHQLKVECDTYLWNLKRMSRRIAFLEYWMERLFKYGSSPEAKRNHLTMTTEIPDYLIREGEDILHHLEERLDLEKVDGII